jgi:hypothetical protein
MPTWEEKLADVHPQLAAEIDKFETEIAPVRQARRESSPRPGYVGLLASATTTVIVTMASEARNYTTAPT